MGSDRTTAFCRIGYFGAPLPVPPSTDHAPTSMGIPCVFSAAGGGRRAFTGHEGAPPRISDVTADSCMCLGASSDGARRAAQRRGQRRGSREGRGSLRAARGCPSCPGLIPELGRAMRGTGMAHSMEQCRELMGRLEGGSDYLNSNSRWDRHGTVCEQTPEPSSIGQVPETHIADRCKGLSRVIAA